MFDVRVTVVPLAMLIVVFAVALAKLTAVRRSLSLATVQVVPAHCACALGDHMMVAAAAAAISTDDRRSCFPRAATNTSRPVAPNVMLASSAKHAPIMSPPLFTDPAGVAEILLTRTLPVSGTRRLDPNYTSLTALNRREGPFARKIKCHNVCLCECVAIVTHSISLHITSYHFISLHITPQSSCSAPTKLRRAPADGYTLLLVQGTKVACISSDSIVDARAPARLGAICRRPPARTPLATIPSCAGDGLE